MNTSISNDRKLYMQDSDGTMQEIKGVSNIETDTHDYKPSMVSSYKGVITVKFHREASKSMRRFLLKLITPWKRIKKGKRYVLTKKVR